MDGGQRDDFHPAHRLKGGNELADFRHRERQALGCNVGGFGKHLRRNVGSSDKQGAARDALVEAGPRA